MKKKLWFKRKLFGWGWCPASWEGWFITILYLVAIITFASIFPIEKHPAEFIVLIMISIISLTWICYKHGEKPRWQWGRK